MKGRESGMPEESKWASFFNVSQILDALEFNSSIRTAVEFGAGYGTFSIPASRIVSERLVSLDIEPDLVEKLAKKAKKMQLPIQSVHRDFAVHGTGLAGKSMDYVMLFNILHIENPILLLKEACRVLKSAGKIGIIHWNYDASTPRGPSMDIRPRPEDCIKWAMQADLKYIKQIDLPPYHYGLLCIKEGKKS